MNAALLIQPLSPWQDGSGAYTDVVIDSRIRLVRNLARHRFPQQADNAELAAVAAEGQQVMSALSALGQGTYEYVDLAALTPLQRELLAAKHISSASQISHPEHRGLMLRQDGAISVMVNDSDHFCIHTAASGCSISRVWDMAAAADDCLEEHMAFAFRDDFGYLTASPSLTGTGLVAAVTIHVPALVMMKRLNRIAQGITKFGFSLHGLYGVQGEYIGNIFQISNQLTLGVTEEETLGQLKKITEQVVQEERSCRRRLWDSHRDERHDAFCRSYGLLSTAWLMSEQEAVSLLSDLQFAMNVDVISADPLAYEELLLTSTAAFLQYQAGKVLTDTELDRLRAAAIRRRMTMQMMPPAKEIMQGSEHTYE